jgi:hypothetical protein
MTHFDLNPIHIDYMHRPFEASIKTISYIIAGNIFPELNDMNIYDFHIPPVILESARVLAYMGASIPVIKFIKDFFSKPKDEDKK